MPPEVLNLSAVSEGRITAPQPRNFDFLFHRSVKIFVFLPFPIHQVTGSNRFFFWGGGATKPHYGFVGHGPKCPLSLDPSERVIQSLE